jgi:hypothetical protein
MLPVVLLNRESSGPLLADAMSIVTVPRIWLTVAEIALDPRRRCQDHRTQNKRRVQKRNSWVGGVKTLTSINTSSGPSPS